MVLLIGNYAPDRQQSMVRFGTMMLEGLTAAGVAAELIQPEPVFGNFRLAGGFVAKWLAYVDKFLLFPRRLRARIKLVRPALVHICDHSNSMYTQHVDDVPVLVTCHDLLAVRGALGEETDTPASSTGKLLQKWIVSGLRRATVIACDSQATQNDAETLVRRDAAEPKLEVITLGLSYPYRKIAIDEAWERLRHTAGFERHPPFVLHVGSNLRRKNREAVLRIFAACKNDWEGRLVFAGETLSESLRESARALGIMDRILEVQHPTNQLLESLYNCATALLFPSRFEGFGWPIIEAQACGCPVICSSTGPMMEVGGEGALLHEPDDESGFARDLVRLTNANEHALWSAKALENAKRFTTDRMIADYQKLYRLIAPLS